MSESSRKPSGRGGAKLQADSYVELPAGLSIAHGRLSNVLRRNGERYDPGHLLTQIVADALTVPTEELLRRAIRGRMIVDAIRGREEPGPGLEPSELVALGLEAPAGGPAVKDDDAGWRAMTKVPLPAQGLADGEEPPVKNRRGGPKRRT